jgi:Heparinase II/III-like protein
LGWRWANKALQSQISEDGVYMQQSTNYHRLMLHAALWLNCLTQFRGDVFPSVSLERLQLATGWLLSLLDSESGKVPNLGPNDGANILPLSCGPFRDFRPVLQAASGAFLGERALPLDLWDETALWLGIDLNASSPVAYQSGKDCREPLVLRSKDGWAYLRAARFTERPGHADQLHLDLWWRGHNIAQDAGTYLYNAVPPWDNTLSRSLVHNTVTVNGKDQMTWAGRFLWLDWAQASQIQYVKAEDGDWERVSAVHDGYRKSGVIHRRVVTLVHPDDWRVEDELFESRKRKSASSENLRFRLHWLLPDWQWKLEQSGRGITLGLQSPQGEIFLQIAVQSGENPLPDFSIQLVRAGVVLQGEGNASPVLGWVSPTYGVKEPALSFSLSQRTRLPLKFISEWTFPQT